jgi:hypothetical protein
VEVGGSSVGRREVDVVSIMDSSGSEGDGDGGGRAGREGSTGCRGVKSDVSSMSWAIKFAVESFPIGQIYIRPAFLSSKFARFMDSWSLSVNSPHTVSRPT